MQLNYNRGTVKWILIVIALLIVSNSLNIWTTDRKYQQVIAQNEHALRGLQYLSDSVTTRYDIITTDLELALKDRGRLQGHVEEMQAKYKINITEVSELIAVRDTIYVIRTGTVIPADECSGMMFVNMDTLGVYLDTEIQYPSGRYKLDIDFKPLDLVVTVERTDKGLKRHTAYFPNQPWYTISSWDVIVEEGEGAPPSLIKRLIGDIGDIGFTLGGGVGMNPTGMALISVGNLHLGMDSEERVILMRTFRLFE